MNFLRRLVGSTPPAPQPAESQPASPPEAAEPMQAQSAAVPEPTPDAPVEPTVLEEELVEEDTLPVEKTMLREDENQDEDEADLPPDIETKVTKPLDPDSVDGVITFEGATRELTPLDPQQTSLRAHLTFGVATHIGAVRSNNQDSAFTFFSAGRSVDDIPDFGLFIVADGMGGHHDGEKASALAARAIAGYITKQIYLPLLTGDGGAQGSISEMLVSAVERANNDLNQKVPNGGTTLSSCVVIAGMAYIAHVGDSRVYLIQRDSIEQITRDHSLVQRLIELDQLTPEEAKDHPQHNVLYRALGQNEMVEVDTITRRLPPRSRLLICSDGLWNLVEDHDILDIIRQCDNPQDACNKLINLANMRGGQDNITVVLLYMPG